ncbi:MAG: M28 family peptidase [Paludibacteraceae bacterium]
MKNQLFSVLILFLLLDFSISAQVGSEKHGVDFVADTAILRSDMQRIMDYGYRNYKNPDVLDNVAYFIKNKFKTLTDSVTEQVYNVNGKDYRNIIASFNANKNERLIIGAHYDVYGDQDGADDNGSAVVGLIRLAQLLKDEKLDFRIDFVAYTLEEPPFFRTENMGSYVHASCLKKNNVPVKGMICLESIGYFSDEKGSQTYSTPFHKLTMGTAGNYILVVSRKEDGEFGKAMTNKMKDAGLISTKSVKGLKRLKGVDLSDHRNYWKYGYPAVMITNTAYYRNKNYDRKSDTIETIDFRRLSAVIHQLNMVVREL